MKNNTVFKFLFAGFIACLLGLALQSFAPFKAAEKEAEVVKVENVTGENGEAAKMYWAVGGYYRTNYRLDTITNAEQDTFGLVSRTSTTAANALASYSPFLSLYSLNLKIRRTNISGTTSVKMYLDESVTTTPTATGWVTVDSTTTTGATVGIINRSELLGEIYRIRIVGAGTQSSSYLVQGIAKKKN